MPSDLPFVGCFVFCVHLLSVRMTYVVESVFSLQLRIVMWLPACFFVCHPSCFCAGSLSGFRFELCPRSAYSMKTHCIVTIEWCSWLLFSVLYDCRAVSWSSEFFIFVFALCVAGAQCINSMLLQRM